MCFHQHSILIRFAITGNPVWKTHLLIWLGQGIIRNHSIPSTLSNQHFGLNQHGFLYAFIRSNTLWTSNSEKCARWGTIEGNKMLRSPHSRKQFYHETDNSTNALLFQVWSTDQQHKHRGSMLEMTIFRAFSKTPCIRICIWTRAKILRNIRDWEAFTHPSQSSTLNLFSLNQVQIKPQLQNLS